jgi:hypothetical protein
VDAPTTLDDNLIVNHSEYLMNYFQIEIRGVLERDLSE